MPKPVWISAKEAALFLSEKYGRRITDQHVRDYARQGHIVSRPVDGRTNEYNRRDVEKLEIRTYKRKPKPNTTDEAVQPLLSALCLDNYHALSSKLTA